ncbi:MAG TPA: hypothetical protein DIC45_14055, partial [Comamonadaceae bacterium]|nr:hypothetical protein [Comamonadaceae bacterium]
MPQHPYTAEDHLQGRVAVVTGGASGLGAAAARALQARGAQVVALDRTAPADAPQGIAWMAADVSDDEAMEQAFERIRERHGSVYVLVNCAGVAQPGSVVRKGQAMPLAE